MKVWEILYARQCNISSPANAGQKLIEKEVIIMADQNLKVSPAQLQQYLSGVDYPASKDDLIQRAQDNGADQQVLDMLDSLPEQNYDSPTDVSRELGNME